MQALNRSYPRYSTLFHIIPCYTKIFAQFPCLYRRFFVPFLYKTEIYSLVPRSHRTCDPLFPTHFTADSLAETTRTSCLRPRFGVSGAVKTKVVPTMRSQQNLPSTLAAITARFSCISGSLTFSSQKSNFQ